MSINGREKVSILLEQIKNDDENAFEGFFYIYQPAVFRFLYRYTGDSDTSDDLTQETFIKFWLNRSKIDLTLSPTAYLFRIAHNLAVNSRLRDIKKGDVNWEEQVGEEYPAEKYEHSFLMGDFQNAINNLPERCRAIFIMSRYEDLSYDEIAKSLGISLQTVKNQMNKAINYLRTKLTSHLK